MRIDRSFLRSKLGHRIFLMFVACALLPIAGLFLLSFNQVTNHLKGQSHKRLKQAVRAHGLFLYERLLFLEAEMQLLASSLRNGGGQIHPLPEPDLSDRIQSRFKGLFLLDESARPTTFYGNLGHPPTPSPTVLAHVNSGKTAILSGDSPEFWPRIFMLRRLNGQEPKKGLLLGEIDPVYLWGANHENSLPFGVEYCVLDAPDRLIFSSFGSPGASSNPSGREIQAARSDLFELRWDDRSYVACQWAMFLKPKFLVPRWTLVVLQSHTDVLAPIADFKKMFVRVVLLALGLVLLFSLHYIRKSLGPLEKLKEGTRRIAMKDFECRVEVDSHDEFEDLAHAFNEMSQRLSRQFKALVTRAEIDRLILSTWETAKIVEAVIAGMHACFPCDAISISLLDPDRRRAAQTYIGRGNPQIALRRKSVDIKPADWQTLEENREYLRIDANGPLPAYLAPLTRDGIRSFWVLPVFLKTRLAAIIALGGFNPAALNEEALGQARQMADQVAVALSNSYLVQELNQLNWGTLQALARAVDAKSSWTAGHSERVTRMALKIGHTLQLTSRELDNLQRAALLHDIGKLGVPVRILDNPGRLNQEESEIIQAHPRMGVRILEPIKAFAEIIPSVLQHHEQFDGQGYPDGLAGENISLGARILAVADVFDALISDRPYRRGWPLARVIAHIRKEAGHKLDPRVVEAFLTAVEGEEIRAA
ncbi:MAG: HD domain-containing protein [Desulfobacterales bacterium]|nr:MAG: HD domain-containing protein [Desulfobacterales bacterium]